MDEEDRKTALSQITNYDQSICKQCPHSNRTFAVVVVPPKGPDTQEKWVAVNALKGVINTSIRQPDPERKAICGHNECCLCYWYADELPLCIVLAVVSAVIFSILTTPLVLLCFVPMIHRMNKVNKIQCHIQWNTLYHITSLSKYFIGWTAEYNGSYAPAM